MRNRIKELLHGVFHPELEQDIVTAGIFEAAEYYNSLKREVAREGVQAYCPYAFGIN